MACKSRKSRNALISNNRLWPPPEIWAMIMQISLLSETKSSYYQRLGNLRLVSSFWDRVIIQQPAFWSLQSPEFSSQHRRLSLSRSGDFPLNIEYPGVNYHASSKQDSLWDDIKGELHRCGSFRRVCDEDVTVWPSGRCLHLKLLDLESISNPFEIHDGYWPNLTVLRFQNINLILYTLPTFAYYNSANVM